MGDVMVSLLGFDRIRLAGDEDGGVSLLCRYDDCWDGGRPLAYLYAEYQTAYDQDPKVITVQTVAAMLSVARGHLDQRHAGGS